MKVLLTETLDKVGIVGTVVEVSEGYARNYLLPKRLGITPSEGNIKRLETARVEYEKKLRELRQQKEQLIEKLTGFEITLMRQANDEGHLFGSVSRRDIAEELQKAGFAITPDDVRLDEPLRRVDTFHVPVQLASDLRTDIKLWIVRENAGQPAEGQPTAEAAPAEEAADESEADEA